MSLWAGSTDAGAKIRSHFVNMSTLAGTSAEHNTVVTSAEIDGGDYGSAKIIIQYDCGLTAAKTYSHYVGLKSCATSGGTYDTATSLLASSTAIDTGLATLGTDIGTKEINVDLSGYKRYLKIDHAPFLSLATGPDAVGYGITFLGLARRTQPSSSG